MTHTNPVSHPWRLIALLVVAILSLSLVNPGARAQNVPASALASQFFNAVSGEAPAYMLSTNAVLHSPEGTYTGVTGPAQFGEGLAAAFSDVRFTVQSTAEAADGWVIAAFALTGINTGSYRGLAANCAGVSVPGVALLRLSDESIVSPAWESLPRDQRNSFPVYETVTLVTEQWVNYDADALASQIATFNAFDPNTRPGCSDHVFDTSDIESADAPTPEPAPSCITANECALPY